MTWCNTFNDVRAVENNLASAAAKKQHQQQQQQEASLVRTCPSCGHHAQYEQVLASLPLLHAMHACCLHDYG